MNVWMTIWFAPLTILPYLTLPYHCSAKIYCHGGNASEHCIGQAIFFTANSSRGGGLRTGCWHDGARSPLRMNACGACTVCIGIPLLFVYLYTVQLFLVYMRQNWTEISIYHFCTAAVFHENLCVYFKISINKVLRQLSLSLISLIAQCGAIRSR